MAGPLSGLRVVEIVGMAAAPFCGMVLADMGADVVRVDRPNPTVDARHDPLSRGKTTVTLDLKTAGDLDALLQLVERADIVFEGFRPGVAERLGFGPDVCLACNPRLVYGRLTGWGRTGPYAHSAGHDINYIALAGVLAHIGQVGSSPTIPLNLIGDIAGGGLSLAFGLMCAVYESSRSGAGQVVDAAMVDGAALLMTLCFGRREQGSLFDQDVRGAGLLDGGAHFYNTYRCADGEFIAIGAVEPSFYRELLERLGLESDAAFGHQTDQASWPTLRARLDELFARRTRAEWVGELEYTDACFAPVLSMGEALVHPHNVERKTFVDVGGVAQPAPAPRFSRTPPAAPVAGGAMTSVAAMLGEWVARVG